MEKYQYFNGERYCRDEKTGYFLSSKAPRKRIHRAVWEHYHGEIPQGFLVHHIDQDKSNNAIENLMLMPKPKHSEMHTSEYAKRQYDKIIHNMNTNVRPKAVEWHKSSAGRKWHKKHYENTKTALYEKVEKPCMYCGASFKGTKGNSSKFCSNKCKSAHRRKSGLDNIEKICENCGGAYIANKYQRTSFCSPECNMQGRKNRKN